MSTVNYYSWIRVSIYQYCLWQKLFCWFKRLLIIIVKYHWHCLLWEKSNETLVCIIWNLKSTIVDGICYCWACYWYWQLFFRCKLSSHILHTVGHAVWQQVCTRQWCTLKKGNYLDAVKKPCEEHHQVSGIKHSWAFWAEVLAAHPRLHSWTKRSRHQRPLLWPLLDAHLHCGREGWRWPHTLGVAGDAFNQALWHRLCTCWHAALTYTQQAWAQSQHPGVFIMSTPQTWVPWIGHSNKQVLE